MHVQSPHLHSPSLRRFAPQPRFCVSSSLSWSMCSTCWLSHVGFVGCRRLRAVVRERGLFAVKLHVGTDFSNQRHQTNQGAGSVAECCALCRKRATPSPCYAFSYTREPEDVLHEGKHRQPDAGRTGDVRALRYPTGVALLRRVCGVHQDLQSTSEKPVSECGAAVT